MQRVTGSGMEPPDRERSPAPGWLSAVVEQSSEAIVVFGDAGLVLYANPAVHEILRIAPEALVGRNALDFVHEDDLDRAASNVVAVSGGVSPRSGFIRIHRGDGSDALLDVMPMRIELPGPPNGPGAVTVVTIRDSALQDAHAKFLTALAAGEPFEVSVATLAEGLSGTVDGPMGVAFDDEAGVRRAVGDLPPELVGVTPDGRVDTTPGSLWEEAVRSGAPVVRTTRELDGPLRARADSIGAEACVIVPIPDPAHRNPVLMVQWPPGAAMGEVVMEALVRRPRLAVMLALERRDAQRRLEHLALHDELTGLANRSRFFEVVTGLCRARVPFGICYIDLDRFKPVNDALGHLVGDIALAACAGRLRGAARVGDLVARVGGDEFAIACPGVVDAAVLAGIAERLVDSLREPLTVAGHEVTVGASVGGALGIAGDEPAGVVAAADRALYDAKRSGRSTWRLADRTRTP